MLEFFRRLFVPETSGATARERLRLVLLSDHLSLAPDVVDSLRTDLIAVISKYVEVDEANCDVSFEQQDRAVAVLANIPIVSMRSRPGPPPNAPLPAPASVATLEPPPALRAPLEPPPALRATLDAPPAVQLAADPHDAVHEASLAAPSKVPTIFEDVALPSAAPAGETAAVTATPRRRRRRQRAPSEAAPAAL
jgi:cell division topological specificity factor